MKKIMIFCICLLALGAYSCTGEDRPITMDQLPPAARQFVMQHFEGVQIAYTSEDPDLFSKSYDVWFVSGDNIQFAKDGAWTDVDCSHSAVPVSVTPRPIADYLLQNYPAAVVKKIEHNKRGYELKLDNGMELKFNKQFLLVKIDD